MADQQGAYPSLPPPPYAIDPQYLALTAQVLASRRRAPPPPEPLPTVATPRQGFFTDVGHGFARGAMVSLPDLAGKALQAFGADETGKAIEQDAAERGKDPLYQVNPEGWGEAASMTVPALATAGLALIPGVGQVAAPAAAAALFGASQYTDTRERGGTVGQALGTAAIQGVGQAVAGHVGGKLLSGAAGMVRAPTAQGVLDSFARPSILGTVAKNTAAAAAIQVPTQAAAMGGVAAVEHDLPNTPSAWEAAKQSVAPTLMMTALMAPFAAIGTGWNARKKAQASEALTTAPDPSVLSEADMQGARKLRIDAAMAVYREMRKVDPDAANAWIDEANAAVLNDQAVKLDTNFKYATAQEAPVPSGVADLPKFDVQDLGLPEEINVHAAERYQDETIDVHAPPTPEETRLPGYDVSELPAGDEINVRTPEQYGDQTIDIHAPLQDEPLGGAKGGRGSQPSPDEIAGRLEAARAAGGSSAGPGGGLIVEQRRQNAEAPDQGTARALGLTKTSESDGSVTYSVSKQERVAWLQDTLGKKTGGLTSKLADLPPTSLADALQQVWHEKGGDNSKTQYVQKIEALYRELTGRDIREVRATELGEHAKDALADKKIEAVRKSLSDLVEQEKTDASVQERTGAESKSAADTAITKAAGAGDQVPEAARDATAGRGAGEAAQASVVTQPEANQFSGDTNALSAQEVSRPLRQEASRKSAATVPQERNAQAEGVPAKVSAAVAKREAAAAALAQKSEQMSAIDGQIRDTRKSISKLNSQVVGKITAEQQEAKANLRQREAALLAQREQIVKPHSDAVGAEERARSGEPTQDAGYYSFGSELWNSRKSLQGNLPLLRSYMEALLHTGQGAHLKGMLGDLGMRVSQGTRRNAQAALDSLSKEQRDQYNERVDRYRSMLDGMTERKASNRKIARAIRDQVLSDQPFQQRATEIDRMARKGEITQGEAAQRRQQLAIEREIAQDKLDSMGRGLAGISESSLNDVLTRTPTAAAALEHIAKTHSNPLVREVAKLLAKDSLTTVEVVENPEFDGGRYIPSTDTIQLGRGGVNAVTMMHEQTHAKAHVGIEDARVNEGRDPAKLNAQEKAEVEALGELRKVMDKFRGMADLNDPAHRLALEDEHEFLSEALNNPQIQDMLGGKSGLLTRVYNAIAKWLHLPQSKVTDFEKLMRSATDLFGDARSRSQEIFGSPINRDSPGDPMQSPYAAVSMMEKATNQLASVSPKLAEFLAEKNIKQTIRKEVYGWMTLNHTTQLMDRTIEQMTKRFPDAAKHLAPLANSFKGFRNAISLQKSMSNFLLREANDLQKRKLRFQQEHNGLFDRVVTMGTEGSRLGFDPAAKSFESAHARNPELTREMYDSKEARDLRAEHAKLVGESERIRRSKGDKADTPISLYNDELAHNDLMNARQLASLTKQAVRLHDLHTDPNLARHLTDLSWENHRKLSLPEQRQKLIGYVNDVQKKLEAMSTNPDAVSAKEAVDDAYGVYQSRQKVPYFHLGRVGDWFVKATVSDVPGAWERVGQVIGAGRGQGGLNRAWGPPVRGNRDMYMRFESELAHIDAVKKLDVLRREGMFKDETEGDTWASGKADELFRGTDSGSPRFLQIIKGRIRNSDVYDSETKQQMLNDVMDAWIQQLPETSSLKSSLFRDGDVGYSKDYIQTSASRATMANNALVKASVSPHIGESMSGLDRAMRGLNAEASANPALIAELERGKTQMQGYVSELKSRVSDMNRPVNSPITDRARALTAAWRLALSPAYMMMTMYQPWQVTLPIIGSRHGMVKTATTMARNAALSFAALNKALSMGWATEQGSSTFSKLSNMSDLTIEFGKLEDKQGVPLFNPQQLDVLDHLQWSGLLNFGQANQIARMNADEMGGIAKASRIASVFPHYAEVSNRIIAMLTAHELATGKGVSHDEAKNYALQVVRDTDGDHSQANIARRLGRRGVFGAATPLAVGFQQYNIQMTELLMRTFAKAWGTGKDAREAQMALGGIAATTAAVAGTLGLPFVGLASAVANGVMTTLGGDNDEPPDMQHAWRETMNQTFGQKGGEVISRGLPRLLDFDMSGRSGFQDIAPFSRFLADRRKLDDKLADGALDFVGPAVGAVAGMWTGARAAYEGDYVKAINGALPTALRNMGKAYRLSQYGYETENGNNQIPIGLPSTWNVLSQSLGLTPAVRAEQSERVFAFNTNQQLLQRRHQVINNEIYRAVEHGDYAALGKALESTIDFSVQHPQFHTDVASGLKERAQYRAVGESSGTGVLTGPRQYPTLQRFQF